MQCQQLLKFYNHTYNSWYLATYLVKVLPWYLNIGLTLLTLVQAYNS